MLLAELGNSTVDDSDLCLAVMCYILYHRADSLICLAGYIKCMLENFFILECAAGSVCNCDSFLDQHLSELVCILILGDESVRSLKKRADAVDSYVSCQLVPDCIEYVLMYFSLKACDAECFSNLFNPMLVPP